MIHLRSTQNCTNSPRILFALEECQFPYDIEVVADGTFTKAYGIPGPDLHDEGRLVIEVGAILRYVGRRCAPGSLWPDDLVDQAHVDRWLDFFAIRISRSLSNRDLATQLTLLEGLERHLDDKTWLLGDSFTIADCGASTMWTKRAALPLDRFPRITGYLDRLGARAAWHRAQAKTPRS